MLGSMFRDEMALVVWRVDFSEQIGREEIFQKVETETKRK